MDRWTNTEKMNIFQKELCEDCPDAPMDDCPCGCMRKAIYNALCRLKDYEEIGLEPEEVEILKQCQSASSDKKAKAIKKLQSELEQEREKNILIKANADWFKSELDRAKAELAQADKEGWYVVLPCEGWFDIVFGEQDIFYRIDKDYIENPIREISVDNEERFTWYTGWETVVIKGADENGFEWNFSAEDIGKTVFLTREEAEEALRKEDRNNV